MQETYSSLEFGVRYRRTLSDIQPVSVIFLFAPTPFCSLRVGVRGMGEEEGGACAGDHVAYCYLMLYKLTYRSGIEIYRGCGSITFIAPAFDGAAEFLLFDKIQYYLFCSRRKMSM